MVETLTIAMSSSTSSSQHRKISQEELSDSWVTCELDADGENSEMLSKEMERLLRDAQRESGQSSLVSSPKGSKVGSLPNTPFNSLQSTPRGSGHLSPIERTTQRSPGMRVSQEDKSTEESTSSTDDVDAADLAWRAKHFVSTPEIRPRKNVSYQRPQRQVMNLSFRKRPVMKSGIPSWDSLKIIIPSIILANIIGLGIGFYLGRRCHHCSVTAL